MTGIDLKIVGAEEARDWHDKGWPTKAVSLIGKKDAHRCPCRGDHHLVLFFDDTERRHDIDWVSCSPWHIQRVLDHTADLKDGDRLLLNCKAGKSRSTAIGIAVMIQHGMSAQEAFDHVREVRNILLPNRLMIEMIDEHFGLDGELDAVVAAYYDTLILPGIKLPNRGGWNL